MAAAANFVGTGKLTPQSFLNADSANTKKTIATAGANGSKVVGVSVSSTDTSARIIQLWLTRGGTDYLITSLTVPITAGTDGVTAVADALALAPYFPRDADGQTYFFLEANDLLKASFTTQVTSAKEIDVFAHFGNF